MRCLFGGHLPAQDLEPSVFMLGDGRAGFNEIAGVDIVMPSMSRDHGMMYVAADDPVGMMPARGFGQGRLEAPMKFTAFFTLSLAQAENDQ